MMPVSKICSRCCKRYEGSDVISDDPKDNRCYECDNPPDKKRWRRKLKGSRLK